ncbi:coiled-coil domain-containing protein 28A-like isoform X2 [Corticium candelabrum]|uniref:coiled-coil domain-containing protein 28A-like isoform X2 n=1 Tax=Corticium candelabrum TaxID=121492 RepID=UPI002E2640EC|nr:coiled-coil domain-containing protein 28A-like isoform X2 [Corticium candelabrum]
MATGGSSARRSGRSSRKLRDDAQHSFKSDMVAARETHRNLQKLFEDVKEGKLKAFDSEEAFAHVTKIRALQDELVEKHLEISQAHQRAAQSDNPLADWQQLDNLMENLHKVCDAVHQFEPQVEASDAAGGSGVNLKRRDSLV